MSLPGPDGHSDLTQSIFESAVQQARAEKKDALSRFFDRLAERRKNPKLDLSSDDRAFLQSIGVNAE